MLNIEKDIKDEITKAESKFPEYNSYHEGYAIIIEEVDELWELVKTKGHAPKEYYDEAKQIACKIFLEIPRTLQDCTDEFCRDNEFQKGTVFEHVMRMKRDGIVTQFSDGTYVMAVK